MKILAVDISALFRMAWEANQGATDSSAYRATASRIMQLRIGYDAAVLCCDPAVRRPFRRTIWESYKAERTDPGEAYAAQLRRLIDELRADGCAVVFAPEMPGYNDADNRPTYAEADDVIGSLCAWALSGGHAVRIVSPDKDMRQLVRDGVDIIGTDGTLWDAAAVREKHGVDPEHFADLLAICGDKSDGYKPFAGIGPERAAKLITECLTTIPPGADWRASGGALLVLGIAPSRAAELIGAAAAKVFDDPEADDKLRRALAVARIRTDLTLDFSAAIIDAAAERAKRSASPVTQLVEGPRPVESLQPQPQPKPSASDSHQLQRAESARTPAVRPSPMVFDVSSAEFRLALEPDMSSIMSFCRLIHESGTYRHLVANEAAVFSVVQQGRFLGLTAMQALNNCYMVNGRIGWSARMLRSMCLARPDICERFDIIEATTKRCRALIKRRGSEQLEVVTTIEDAQERKFLRSDGKATVWNKDPLVMLQAETERRGSRQVFPDIVTGLVTRDELEMEIEEGTA